MRTTFHTDETYNDYYLNHIYDEENKATSMGLTGEDYEDYISHVINSLI